MACRVILVSGIGLRMIRSSVEKPSCVFYAKSLSFSNLVVSMLASEVGRSRFIVKVYGAAKFSGVCGLGWWTFGKICSMNLQLANLALSRFPVVGSRYLIIEGGSNPTYVPCWRFGPIVSFFCSVMVLKHGIPKCVCAIRWVVV